MIRDFVNTADLEEESDELVDAGASSSHWLVCHGLAQLRHRATDEDAAEARAVREALRDLLSANNGRRRRPRPSRTLDMLPAMPASPSASRPVRSLPSLDAGHGVSGGLDRLLAAVGEAMADGSWRRLKACRSDSCRFAFIDNARNQSRQWCSTCRSAATARKPATFGQRMRRGARIGAPLLPAGSLGASFGVLARTAHFDALAAVIMSATTFAGSAQVATVSVLGGGGASQPPSSPRSS